MHLITRRDVIRSVPGKWHENYSRYPDDAPTTWCARTYGDIRRSLAALDTDRCVASDIDEALGANGWALLCCDECDTDSDVLMHFGDEPYYEAKWQRLCVACLQRAVVKMNT